MSCKIVWSWTHWLTNILPVLRNRSFASVCANTHAVYPRPWRSDHRLNLQVQTDWCFQPCRKQTCPRYRLHNYVWFKGAVWENWGKCTAFNSQIYFKQQTLQQITIWHMMSTGVVSASLGVIGRGLIPLVRPGSVIQNLICLGVYGNLVGPRFRLAISNKIKSTALIKVFIPLQVKILGSLYSPSCQQHDQKTSQWSNILFETSTTCMINHFEWTKSAAQFSAQ